jgi:hypothetical protein
MIDRYVILKGDRDGKPWIGSADRQYPQAVKKNKLQWACEIWIHLKKVDEIGFPDKVEFKKVEDFENQLLEHISNKTPLHLVGKITWNGKRYLLAYIEDAKVASDVLEKIIESKKNVWEFEYKIEKDSDQSIAKNSFEWTV